MPQTTTMKRVALQGIEGSFHDIAAKRYFAKEEISIEGKNTFRDCLESLKNDEVDVVCMAIENSISGSIYENYDLLREYRFQIFGELFLRVQHNLIALPDVKREDIKFVMAHPVALRQCKKYIAAHNLEAIEFRDNAASVKEVHDKQLKDTGAFASTEAAKLYKMQIIDRGVQDCVQNYTRFLFLRKENIPQEYDKISFNFQVSNEPGALLRVLIHLNNVNGNMTKLESRPILGRIWQYQFYMDVIVRQEIAEHLIELLSQTAKNLIVLGRYKKGIYIE